MRAAAFDRLRQTFVGAEVSFGTLVMGIDAPDLLDVVGRLRAAGFDLLLDVTAIDWPARTPRFDVVWHLYSTTDHVRARVKCAVPESDPAVDSLTGMYGSAAFMERECHDMYGIAFRGNGDLRPILLYEGFAGHPLRKDYAKDHEQPLVRYRT